jgi:hypothetical protein
VVSSPEFAPVPNPSTAHVISSRLASNRTHLKAQVMLSPHGDKARRLALFPHCRRRVPPTRRHSRTARRGRSKRAGRRRDSAPAGGVTSTDRPDPSPAAGPGKGARAGTPAGSGQCGPEQRWGAAARRHSYVGRDKEGEEARSSQPEQGRQQQADAEMGAQ